MKKAFPGDTVAAIATGRGEGGIGIIRISGPASLPTALKIFKGRKKDSQIKSHHLYYGDIIDPSDNRVIDEVLLSFMKGPRSFTAEDVVEINSHGGSLILQKIMEILLREGIKEAGPGEFTKRAFLNGRLDLSQAEAVIDLIRAKTEGSMKLATRQLKGGLKKSLEGARSEVMGVLALVEAYIDFPEEDIDLSSLEELGRKLALVRADLDRLVSTYEDGRVYREGIHVVIAGRPNVGKSSLLNALLQEKRAIVTSVPGTTRDIIEEIINIEGIPVRLIDTAGIRETLDLVEEEGIKRAKEKLDDADIVLYMIDDEGMKEEDSSVLENCHARTILVVNKEDRMKDGRAEDIASAAAKIPHVFISAENGNGLDGLKRLIADRMVRRGSESSEEVILSRKRHKIAVEKASLYLEKAISGLGSASYEFIAMDLKGVLDEIAELAGETSPDDVLDKIFSEFCIGK